MRAYLRRLAEIQLEIWLGIVYAIVGGGTWLTLRARGKTMLDTTPRWHTSREPELEQPF